MEQRHAPLLKLPRFLGGWLLFVYLPVCVFLSTWSLCREDWEDQNMRCVGGVLSGEMELEGCTHAVKDGRWGWVTSREEMANGHSVRYGSEFRSGFCGF